MITSELKSYVEGEVKKGVSKETIKKILIENGWAMPDVEEVFASTAVSFAPPMVSVARPESKPSTTIAYPAVKTHRGKKTTVAIALAVLVLLAGGGAYAYYAGFFLSMPMLVAQSLANVRDAKTATFDTTVSVDFSELQDDAGGLSLGSMLGIGNSRQFSLTSRGQYDASDSGNLKYNMVVSVAFGSFAPEFELRMLDDTIYGKLSKMPALGLFSAVSSIENKWFSLPYGSEAGEGTDAPATQSIGIDTTTMSRLTDEQKEHIYQLTRDASFIKIVKKLPLETIAGEPAYHFLFVLDQEGISSYLQSLKTYVNSVGVDDSALSIFDPTALDEDLDSLRDFMGEAWIGRSDKLPRKVSVSFGIQPDETVAGQIKVKVVSIFSGWNQPVSIVVPAESVPFEEFLSNIMSGFMTVPEEENANTR